MSAAVNVIPFDWSEAIEILERMLDADTAPVPAQPVPAQPVAAGTPRGGALPGTGVRANTQAPGSGARAAAGGTLYKALGVAVPAALAVPVARGRYAVEASELGWPPGSRPPRLLSTDLGVGSAFVFVGEDVHGGEVGGWRYVQLRHCTLAHERLELLVIND